MSQKDGKRNTEQTQQQKYDVELEYQGSDFEEAEDSSNEAAGVVRTTAALEQQVQNDGNEDEGNGVEHDDESNEGKSENGNEENSNDENNELGAAGGYATNRDYNEPHSGEEDDDYEQDGARGQDEQQQQDQQQLQAMQQQQAEDDRISATNLIINYLPQDMTDREMYSLFSSCGPINTCKIMRDYKTGYSFGYGFVDYNTEMDSVTAIQKLNGLYVRNKRLKVSYARPGGQSIKDTNLYVINLPRNINDDQLDHIFAPYGRIVQRNILRDKLTGRPRGVAFVRYNRREEAQEAIHALNNTVPEGAQQPITVRLAEEHGKAKAAQFMSHGGGNGGPMHVVPHHLMTHPHHRPHQQAQQHQQHPHQQHHQQQHHHHHNLPLPPQPHHHLQQMHHHPHGGGGGGGIGVGVGLVPPPMHGGGGGGYHHNMAHRGRSKKPTRSQKPHPYNNAQKFI